MPDTPRSPTAFVLDDWGLRRGVDLLAGSERLQALETDHYAVADFLASAFEPSPELQESCVDGRRREFLAQLLETPAFKALHSTTMLNPAAAEIAAINFAEQFHSLPRDERRPRDEDEGKHRDEEEGKPRDKEVGKERALKDGKLQEAGDRDMETLRAVGRALTRAGDDVAELCEATAALGMGPGSPGSNDVRAIADLFRRMRNNPVLRRICSLAGRYRRVAQSKQRQKCIHGVDEMVGVVLDGDLGRVLPHELARLAIPEFEMDTLRRLVERQVMCREFRSMEPVAKGPVIVAVDESGSMMGNKVETAKALALALAWIARHQRRWIALCAYSGDSGERLLPLPPGRWNETALMDWLSEFIGMGSTLDIPVREMPDYYRRLGAPRGKTDVIFITDAICRLPADVAQKFLTWKKEVQARLISLVIGHSPGDLTRISDETHQVQSLDVGEVGVERVLSI